MNSLWLSPAFLLAAAITLGAGCYSYVYLPLRMRRAYRQSLLTLARAVETKDIGAEGHGERVAAHVLDIAREMKVPRAHLRRMEYAAFLQDIGNVRVPHAVLNKEGQLTDEEFDTLKAHTAIGAEMVEQVKFLGDIAPTIRQHHECWDGSGYPDGLQGEEISLGARILAVATAYDAMASNKAYHGQKGEEQVVVELRAGSGVKWDPAVVEAFLKVLKKRRRGEGQPS